MPPLLTWDLAGATYDSGLTWDAMVAPTQRKSMNIKAIVNFEGYTAPELSPVAQNIHDKMTANAAIFTAPTVTMSNLQTMITTYDAKLVARASGAKADTIAFNDARDALEVALGTLGNYVNSVAKGDAVTVEKSGFPSYDTARTQDNSPPAAPANLTLRRGDVAGTVLARYKPDRPQSTNELQINTGDPSNEADWKLKGIFKGGRAELTGLTPGALIWVRVRTVGNKGVMGAWSDPAKIRVL